MENSSHLFLNIEQLRPGEILEFEKNKIEKSSFLEDTNHEKILSKNNSLYSGKMKKGTKAIKSIME